MKKFLSTFIAVCSLLLVNNTMAQTIATTESRCVNTGTATISGTVGTGGPYQVSVISAPPDYVNTGTHSVADLPDEFDALYPGAYTMKVIDQNGAVFTYPFTIAGNYILPGSGDYSPTTTAVTNCASPDGTIQGVLTNGRPPYNYTIVSGPAKAGTTNSTGTFTGLPAGTYQVQAGDSCQNLQTRSVTVTANSPTYTISDGIINKISCDSFSLDALTISPALPAGVTYEIIDHYTGNYTDVTATSLPIHFAAKNGDITGGYIQIVLSNGCGVLASTDGIRAIANDWDFTAADVTQTCAEGVVLHGVTTTGTILAPYTTTITPVDPYGPPFTSPQPVTNYPYTVTGVNGATIYLKTDVTITDACGVSKTITKDLSFEYFTWENSIHFKGCDSTLVTLTPTGSYTNPVTYTASTNGFTTTVATNTTGIFTLPNGYYSFAATDACGKTGSTGEIDLYHGWTVSFFPGPSCYIGSTLHRLSVPGKSIGAVTYTQYLGAAPVTSASVIVSTQTYSGGGNGIPSSDTSGAYTYMDFDNTLPNQTYTYVVTDSCGTSDTLTYTNDAGKLPTEHSTTVKNKCINKGDIFAAFHYYGNGPTVVNIYNLNSPTTLIASTILYVPLATNTLVANDLPLGTYIVQYLPSYCGPEYSVYDTVVIAPYVQPTVSTVQSFTPCSGGGTPVIVSAVNGVGPYMYEIVNSTPGHYTAPAQTSSVFTLPTSQTTVTVRVLDACLNSTTKTVAITKASSPIVRTTPTVLSTCTLPLSFKLYVDSLYQGSVFEWVKLTGTDAGTTVISSNPSLPLIYNSIADTGTYQVRVTVPGTCYDVTSVFDVKNVIVTCSPGISGNVFDDGNGLTDNTVNGTGTNAGGLNAILVNSSGTVVATTPVAADGTYNFTNVSTGTYSIVLSTATGTIGAAPPSPELPANWVNTGENLGSATGNDGSVNGILTNITVGTTTITNANFGIDQKPVANNVTAPSQANPGGTITVVVPTLNGTDAEDGTYDGISGINTIIINTLPANGTLYYNGTAVTAGQVIPNYTPSLLTVDPNDGNTTITFTYSEVDAAGIPSTPATVIIPFVSLSISGSIFDDANGLTDATVNGLPVNGNDIDVSAAGAQTVYVNLLDNNGKVVATTQVASDGFYNFNGLGAGNYTVQLSAIQGVVTQTAPATQLPASWINTGENIGTAAGNDGTVNGNLAVVLTTTNVTNADFGIEHTPNSDDKTYTITMPVLNSSITLNGTGMVPGPLSGSDPEDGVLGITKTLVITTVPTNANLYYNGVLVTNNTVINNYDPSLLQIKFTTIGATSTSFQYAYVDASGKQDPTPATYTITWNPALPVVLTSFTAKNENDNAVLNWATASELNVKSFNVERSTDNGKTWQTIGEVIAAGNSAVNETYSFTDANPDNGSNLYRLQVEDNNGTSTYSATKEIDINDQSSMSVYPNPVGQAAALNIQLAGLKKGTYNITLVASSGQTVKQMKFNITSSGSAALVIPTGNFPTGSYVVTVTGNDKVYSKTVIIANR